MKEKRGNLYSRSYAVLIRRYHADGSEFSTELAPIGRTRFSKENCGIEIKHDYKAIRIIQPYRVSERPFIDGNVKKHVTPLGRLEGVVALSLEELIRRPPGVEELLAHKLLTSQTWALCDVRWEIVGFEPNDRHVAHIAVSGELVDMRNLLSEW